MEKYFEISRDHQVYKEYFDWLEFRKKILDIYEKFASVQGIESEGWGMTNDLRICTVKDKKAYFHKWSDKSNVIPPSPMVGGHSGGTVSYTVGIVEYIEDGTVHECYPDEIVFECKGGAEQ